MLMHCTKIDFDPLEEGIQDIAARLLDTQTDDERVLYVRERLYRALAFNGAALLPRHLECHNERLNRLNDIACDSMHAMHSALMSGDTEAAIGIYHAWQQHHLRAE